MALGQVLVQVDGHTDTKHRKPFVAIWSTGRWNRRKRKVNPLGRRAAAPGAGDRSTVLASWSTGHCRHGRTHQPGIVVRRAAHGGAGVRAEPSNDQGRTLPGEPSVKRRTGRLLRRPGPPRWTPAATGLGAGFSMATIKLGTEWFPCEASLAKARTARSRLGVGSAVAGRVSSLPPSGFRFAVPGLA